MAQKRVQEFDEILAGAITEGHHLPLDGAAGTRRATVATMRTVLTGSAAVGGDASGPLSALVVDGLQTRPVSASAPGSGNVLTWSGSAWAPAAPPASTLQQAYVAGNIVNITSGEGSLTIEGTTNADATNLLTLTRNHTGAGGSLIDGTLHTAATGFGMRVTLASTPAAGSRAFEAASGGSNDFDAFRAQGSSVQLNVRPNFITMSTGTSWSLGIGSTSKLTINATGVLINASQKLQLNDNGNAGAPTLYFAAIGSTHGLYALNASSPQPARVGIAAAPGLMAAEFGSRTGESSGVSILSRIQFTDATTGTAGWTALEISRLGSGTGSGAKRFVSVVNSSEIFAIDGTGRALGPDGSAAAPTWSYLSDPGNGWYLSAADTLSAAVNGTLQLSISSTQVILAAGQYIAPNGNTPGAPQYSWASSQTMGMYRAASATIAFSTASTLRFSISSTELTATVPILPGTDNSIALGSASFRWSNVFATTTTIGDLVLSSRMDADRKGDACWILREGDDEIFAFNVRTKKKFRLSMIPVNDVDADDFKRMEGVAARLAA